MEENISADEKRCPVMPVARRCPFTPPEEYADWRAQGPTVEVEIPGGRSARVVTRYDDIRKVLTSAAAGSNRLDPNFPRLKAASGRNVDTKILWMDEPVHGHYRRMLAAEFSARKVKALREGMQVAIDDAIDNMLASGDQADLHQAVSLVVPSRMICQLLGISYDRHTVFEEIAARMMDMNASPEEFETALSELEAFTDSEITAQETNPQEGVIGRLITERLASGDMTREQVIGFSTSLLVAGHETTANMISLAVLGLLEDIELRKIVTEDPTKLPPVVEEMLRVYSVSDLGTPRVALDDIEIDGETIPAGTGILALGGAGNHDESVFPDPTKIDPTRGRVPHLAFGVGAHACIGQNLARAELDVVLGTLFRRVPTLSLSVPMSELRFKESSFVYGLRELPVSW